MKRTLIIGAKGFVGPYLERELIEAGHSVCKAALPEVNVLDAESVKACVKNAAPDFLINLAAVSSVGASWMNPTLTMNVNVNGTINVLDACVAGSPKCKVLLVGSSEEYAPKSCPIKETDPVLAENPYGISKIAQENFAGLYRKRYGMKVICTRSFNHTGVGQKETFAIPSFCKQVAQIAKSGKPGKIYVGNLTASRDISDVRNVVHVYRMLIENDDEYNLYNVGSGIVRSMRQILDYIISLSSVSVEVVPDPSRMRPVENPYICCDNSRVKKYWVGYALEDMLKKMYEGILRG